MRRFLLFVITVSLCFNLVAQKLSAKEFLFASSLNEKKFENYFSKRFSPCGNKTIGDTIVNVYKLKTDKRKKEKDSIKRCIEIYRAGDYFALGFFTSSRSEFEENKKALHEEDFFCGADNDSVESYLFQKKNITVLVKKKEKEDTIYSFIFHLEELPSLDKIQYAEDLFQFASHEYLSTVFGEKNVIKDVYYLSEKSIVPCTVIFPRTNRQAIFFWQDEINMRMPSTIMISGNTNNGRSTNYDGLINENIWHSKDGVYPGMSIYSLIKLNGNTFNFYGKKSSSPYLILPDNKGSLDFKSNATILGCLNPTGSAELDNEIVDVGKIVQDNIGLYVFMMIFYPQPASKKPQDLTKNNW